MNSDEKRAENLLEEINLELGAGIGQPDSAENVGVFRRLRWASCGAAEAVRILEAHRRACKLTPKGREDLERYRKFHEAAELVLVRRFPCPWESASTVTRGHPGRTVRRNQTS